MQIEVFAILFTFILGGSSIYNISWRIKRLPELKVGYVKLFIFWLVLLYSILLLTQVSNVPFSEYLPLAPIIVMALWVNLFKGDIVLHSYPGLFGFPVGRADRIRFHVIIILLYSVIQLFIFRIVFLGQVFGTEVIPFVLPAYFIFGWPSVSYLFSVVDGWQWLSENYKLNKEFIGDKSGWLSGTMNGISFNNCLVIGANENGLYLSMIFLFRFGHSQLLIPWSEVLVNKRRFLLWDRAVIEFKKAPGVILSVSEESFNRFRHFIKLEN